MTLSRRPLLQLPGAAALPVPALAEEDPPGRTGVRHQDDVQITEDGAANTTRWPGSSEAPAVV